MYPASTAIGSFAVQSTILGNLGHSLCHGFELDEEDFGEMSELVVDCPASNHTTEAVS